MRDVAIVSFAQSPSVRRETERNEVGAGDIVHVPAGEMHWHGAAPDSDFAHLSIRPPGETNWTQIDPLA